MTTPILILGAGLAGTTLAARLVEEGATPSNLLVIDAAAPHRGSSAPATMLHPFPGRSMAPRQVQLDAFTESFAWLDHIARKLPDDWWLTAPMVRPLPENDKGHRLRDTWTDAHSNYPTEIASRLLTPEDARTSFPDLHLTTAALTYNPAASVVVPRLIDHLQSSLQQAGARFVRATATAIHGADQNWHITLDDNTKLTAHRLVLAMGTGLLPLFPDLDLRTKAGEVLVLAPGKAELSAFVNADAHLFARRDGLWGLGSTYFPTHDWDHRDDAQVTRQLLDAITPHVPAAAGLRVEALWRGVRAIFGSDHLPLAGPVPGQTGLFVLGALGSKGLLFAPALAGQLATHLLHDQPLAAATHPDRITPKRWTFTPPS